MIPFAWIPFFVAPFLWADIFQAQMAADLLFLATGLFAVACMWQPGWPEDHDTIHKMAWLFLLFCTVPMFIHLLDGSMRSPWYALRGVLYLTAAWLVFEMSREKAARLLENRAFIYLLATAASLYVAYALIQAYDVRFLAGERLFPVWSTYVSQFPGPLMQPNEESLFLASVTVILLFHATCRHLPVVIAGILSTITCTGMLLTASRSGLICFILGAVLLFLTAPDRRRYVRLMATCVILSLALSALIHGTVSQAAGPSMANRLETGRNIDRLFVWEMCWLLFLQHPLLGIGWGNLPAYSMDGAIAAYRAHPWLTQVAINPGGNTWAHNLVLQFLMEGGVLGGAALLILIWAASAKLFRILWRNLPASPGMVLGGILSIMLFAQGMVSVSMMQPFFQILLALFLAALFPVRRSTDA